MIDRNTFLKLGRAIWYGVIITFIIGMLSQVTDLSATFIPGNNSVVVRWEDSNNTIELDGNFTYLLSYNISVGDTQLLSNDTELAPSNSSTVFYHTISEGSFIQSGVTITVVVNACDEVGSSVANTVSTTIPGGKA